MPLSLRRGTVTAIVEAHADLVRLEVEAACQVRVEHVEAAAAELELTRLHVDEHVVTDLDGAGQPRVGDTRNAVDLEAHELFVTLDDRVDRSAPKRERHRPAPA